MLDQNVQSQDIPEAVQLPAVDVPGLIRSVTGEVPAPSDAPAAPDKIGEIPREQFFTALTDYSGGAVKDHDSFTQTIQAAGRARDLEKRVAELDGQLKMPKFHDSISERFNSMRSAGHSVAEIRQFLELADLDLGKIDPLDAIRRHYSLTKTGYSPQEIDLAIQRDLGFDPSDAETELSGLQRLTLREKSEAAVQALRQQQVSAQNPQAVAEARHAQAVAEHTVQVWQQVLPGLPVEPKWTLPTTENETAEVAYKPSAEAIQLARNATMADIAANPHQFPPTDESAQAIARIYQNYVFLADMERALGTVHRNGYAKGMEAAMQRTSGNQVVLQRPVGQQQAIKSNPSGGVPNLIG